MNTTLDTDLQAVSASPENRFALPECDVDELLQSSVSSTPLDDQVLLDGCAGSVNFLMLMLGSFQANAESQVDEIARQVQAGDSDAVAEAAGMLKTSAEGVSAGPLRTLAATLQLFCGLMDREAQERVVDRLREETNRCLEHIPLLIATAQLGECAM
jgi:HPt (histidine-containing phosphotransfer) domain-containing protein